MLLRSPFENLFGNVKSQGTAKTLIICCATFLASVLLYSFSNSIAYSSIPTSHTTTQSYTSPVADSTRYVPKPGPPAVGKLSMQYGTTNEYYLRAIDSHARHAARHGYPMYTLGNEVAEGIWNKLAFMMWALVEELQKDADIRTGWLMWCDADSMIVNPALPLDIFLPPSDFPDVHLLATKDQNGFNAGIFFIRVHKWSVHFIAKALAFPDYVQGYDLSFLEQTALYRLMNDTENIPHVLYQPRIWWNTYQFKHGYEGKAGDVLVHFPGLEGDRWHSMEDWLDIVEGPKQAEWEMPLAKTRYPEEVDQYWTLLREARKMQETIKSRVPDLSAAPETLRVAVEHLRLVLEAETDSRPAVRTATDDVKRALELYVSS